MSTVIKVENLGKKYIIGHQKQRGGATLRDTMTHTARGVWQRVRHPLSPNRESIDLEELWALKDVNFEVQEGERIGIIGRNGAGKSTLLKVLSRITEPTTGKVRIKGRVSCLLEVGTGFHPELTGRENVFLNGAILGMTRQEIKKKFDEIVAFAELEKFLDTPVKRYSSGMYVRLAFAVAAHLEPEILIVDEVLAVGDVAFQKKCLGKMENVAKEGRTVLFVSHNMGAIKALCSSAILIDSGRIVRSGYPGEVIGLYLEKNTSSGVKNPAAWKNPSHLSEEPEANLLSVSLFDSSGLTRNSFPVDETVRIVINYKVNRAVSGFRVIAQLQTSEGAVAFTTYEDSSVVEGKKILPGEYRTECIIPPNLLNIDTYYVLVAIDLPKIKVLVTLTPTVRLQIVETTSHFRYYRTPQGVVRPELKWITYNLAGEGVPNDVSDPT